MEHIDRLLTRAKKAINGEGKHVIGFVDYDMDKQKYIASGSVWNGVAGSGVEEFRSEHETREEAEATLRAMETKYPSAKSVVFLLVDMYFSED